MKRTVQVTKNDIQNGTPGSSESCPIALAIRRTFHTTNVDVGSSNDINIKDLAYCVGDDRRLRDRINNFIKRFDKEESVRPFKFVIDTMKQVCVRAR